MTGKHLAGPAWSAAKGSADKATGLRDAALTPTLTAASKEAFGAPEDIISPSKSAVDPCGWLEKIFISTRQEVADSNCRPRISKLAEADADLAADLRNDYDCQHESMLAKLKKGGIVPPDRRLIDRHATPTRPSAGFFLSGVPQCRHYLLAGAHSP